MSKHRQTYRKAHHNNKNENKKEMKYCLGDACYDKKLKFLSEGDGNRLCPQCKTNIERNGGEE